VENLILPTDFKKYLIINNLLDNWNAKNRSFKRGFLEQLLNTKNPEIRMKKILGLGF
jgi:hypothetical protein